MNGWNLRIQAPWNFGKSSEPNKPNHHFQGVAGGLSTIPFFDLWKYGLELSRLVDVGSLQGGPLPAITRVITPVTHSSGDISQFTAGRCPPCSDVYYSTPVFSPFNSLVLPNRKGPVPARKRMSWGGEQPCLMIEGGEDCTTCMYMYTYIYIYYI